MAKLIVGSIIMMAVLLAVACGDDETTTSGGSGTATSRGTGATTGAADVCDQKDAVEAAVADLANVDVRAEGTNALKASVENVKTELKDLKSAVGADVKDEVTDLETAVDDADNTLSGIKDDATLNQKIDAVQSALTGITTASAALAAALKDKC